MTVCLCLTSPGCCCKNVEISQVGVPLNFWLPPTMRTTITMHSLAISRTFHISIFRLFFLPFPPLIPFPVPFSIPLTRFLDSTIKLHPQSRQCSPLALKKHVKSLLCNENADAEPDLVWAELLEWELEFKVRCKGIVVLLGAVRGGKGEDCFWQLIYQL